MTNKLTVEALAAELTTQHPHLREPVLFDLAWHVIAKLNLATDLVNRKPVQFQLTRDTVQALARDARGRRYVLQLPTWTKGQVIERVIGDALAAA